jgi:hypothetical protein
MQVWHGLRNEKNMRTNLVGRIQLYENSRNLQFIHKSVNMIYKIIKTCRQVRLKLIR